ncbi:MAG: hypothetical protein LBD74_06090 [Spirochaetaceae bacterium]|jgi:heptaprenyl diphosphate synthase|nr:hypothetical protein [Spirochaetaceae bacterium]
MKGLRGCAGTAWEEAISSRDRFLSGVIMAVAFMANPDPLLRAAQFLLFWGYAAKSGKQQRPWFTLLVMGGIVFFNLLVPYGRVIAVLGPFPLTAGALRAGLDKALTLEGLILLSKACIRTDLRLPGFVGSLLAESFRIFEGITRRKALITPKRLIQGLDELLLELSAEQSLLAEHRGFLEEVKSESTLLGRLLLGGALALVVGLTCLGFLGLF